VINHNPIKFVIVILRDISNLILHCDIKNPFFVILIIIIIMIIILILIIITFVNIFDKTVGYL